MKTWTLKLSEEELALIYSSLISHQAEMGHMLKRFSTHDAEVLRRQTEYHDSVIEQTDRLMEKIKSTGYMY